MFASVLVGRVDSGLCGSTWWKYNECDGVSEQKQQPFHLHHKFNICISEFNRSELDLKCDLCILA